MEIREKIIRTLMEVADKLQIKSDWYIIGASAMILSDVRVGETSDIDIITTNIGSDELQNSLSEYRETAPKTKEDDLFRSNFARFNLPLMDIEVMGGLQVRKNGMWQNVCICDFNEISVGNLMLRIPTIDEQKRILLLFGRDKDLKRISLLDQQNKCFR